MRAGAGHHGRVGASVFIPSVRYPLSVLRSEIRLCWCAEGGKTATGPWIADTPQARDALREQISAREDAQEAITSWLDVRLVESLDSRPARSARHRPKGVAKHWFES